MSSGTAAGPPATGPPATGPGPLGVFAGLTTLDVVHRVRSRAGRDAKVTATRQDVAAGGPAAGAAVVFAALGGRARLLTALGADVAGAAARAELAERGVEVVDVADVTGPAAADRAATPISAVQVDEATGERSVTSIDAAAASVEPPADLAAHLDGAAVVLLDGHHPALAVAVARAATPARLVLDAGRWRPVVADLLPLVHDAVCSADFRAPGTGDAAASADRLRAAGVPVVVTTAGPDPVRWSEGERGGSVEVPAVRAVDTLGAGDAFHGAYAWALATGSDVPAAVAVAVAVASHRVGSVGPRAWLDSLGGVPAVARAAG